MTIAEQAIQLKQDFDEVYQAGYSAGQSAGGDTDAAYQQGVTDGKQTERQAFWDQIQQGGKRTWYAYCFSYWGDGDCYNPPYPFENAYIPSMFAQSGITNTIQPIISTNKIADGLFNGARELIKVPHLDITLATSVKDAFHNCNNLTDITFFGEIRLSLDMHWSTVLSKDSIKSTVNALSENVSGQTLTLSQDAVLDAFGSTGDGSEWATLIAHKQSAGWTITLA